jgi:hypothetical protein
MSIGNLKDSGNQGNNFPYQKSVLKGLALSQCRNLEELSWQSDDPEDIRDGINNYFRLNPNNYLVSKELVWNGTTYLAFLTIATL